MYSTAWCDENDEALSSSELLGTKVVEKDSGQSRLRMMDDIGCLLIFCRAITAFFYCSQLGRSFPGSLQHNKRFEAGSLIVSYLAQLVVV